MIAATADNNEEFTKIKEMFAEGDLKYNKGINYNEKKEGIKLILNALEHFKTLFEISKILLIHII